MNGQLVLNQLVACSHEIPGPLLAEFAPARLYLFEWTDTWLNLPGVYTLRVGRIWLEPTVGVWFRLRFENQVGLAPLQPYAAGRPLENPIHVLVLSPKAPTPEAHLAFFRQLLNDLYVRASRLPFAIEAPTETHTVEAIRPPMPLFTLHFLCQYGDLLLTALSAIQAFPHRRLADLWERVPLAEVTEIGPGVIADLLHHASEWQRPATSLRITEALRGLAPRRVLQSCPVESFDTPENRFVRHFAQPVLAEGEALLSQVWWPKVPCDRQAVVVRCCALLRQALVQAPLHDLGPMRTLPLRSQALLRREGYREMLTLWQRFQQARRPLFSHLQHAIDLRDIATLYEVWAYFALIDDIAGLLDVQPVLAIEITTATGLEPRATANFGGGRKLLYNRGFGHPTSYSVALRPDYTWLRSGRPDAVFDAKFALDRLANSDDDETTAKRRDLYKMHTYRDALGVRAAVALYPSTERLFYSRDATTQALTLRRILLEDAQGIGALPYRPS